MIEVQTQQPAAPVSPAPISPPRPKNNYFVLFILFFLILAAVPAFLIISPKLKFSLPAGLPALKLPTGVKTGPTPSIAKGYLITNKDSGQTIRVDRNTSIVLALTLNKNAVNTLEADNQNAVQIIEPLKYNEKEDIFGATLKTVNSGETVLTIAEQAKCSGKEICPLYFRQVITIRIVVS